MKIEKILIFIVTCVTFSNVAHAQATRACCTGNDGPKNWYIGISGSAVMLDDVNISHSNPAYSNIDGQTFKTGQAISGAVGYKVLSGVRTEVEIVSRRNTVDKDNVATNALPPGASSIHSSTAVMLNGYIDLHNKTSYTPYFGAGIGKAYVKNPRYYRDNGTGETSDKLNVWATSYQFMTGINYEVSNFSFPFEINMGYRYFTSQDVKTTSSLSNFPSKLEFPNTSHNIELGFRVYF
jgi:opacity protein-like surface antigen